MVLLFTLTQRAVILYPILNFLVIFIALIAIQSSNFSALPSPYAISLSSSFYKS